MATIVLSAAGASAGNATGLPLGGVIGRALGGVLGGVIDRGLGGGTKTLREGARLEDLSVQTSAYGKVIPQVAGRMRLGGNVIWARPLREIATTTTTKSGGKGGGGGRSSSSSTAYSYYASLAVAICEGPVDAIERVWADTKLLDLSGVNVRFYYGGEGQMPDPLIEADQGVGATPAHRGLAYAVFEDFPLGDFGNRIPNFTFEVRKSLPMAEIDGQPLENFITGITLIPGSGEWVYDTLIETRQNGTSLPGGIYVPSGPTQVVNAHARSGVSDVAMALDQLAQTCPNVEWVSVVVNWFGDSLNAGACILQPGVEYQAGGQTSPDTWDVAGYTRETARLITYVGGGPRYGGTPSDASLIRLLAELRARGYKIALYPMILMDVDGKPWRGRLTGSAGDVASFFTKAHGYNEFIAHYASLAVGRVEAFIIGSELRGLTGVMGSAGVFPAVNALVSVAAASRATLGSGVTLTYAADWSEYHHTDGGWYHMDALWASPNIDVVGIDAYFPLTDSAEDAADLEKILAGWDSGEVYDWYYTDEARTTKASLSAAYALKNIEWWWGHTHTQPGGGTSAWTPGMKPIWFTEIGYPSVDGAANQPNVFYDPTSTESALPRFSTGAMDLRAQRLAIRAAIQRWRGSAMVTQMFFWTWDARPYPEWPDRTDVWADGPLWAYGHWLQGKLGLAQLGALVASLCQRAGIGADALDVSTLDLPVDGFAVTSVVRVRDALDWLRAAYFFDVIESGPGLRAQLRAAAEVLSVADADLLTLPNAPSRLGRREATLALPARVEVQYLSRSRGYGNCLQRAVMPESETFGQRSLSFPLVLSDPQAARVAQVTLLSAWLGRTRWSLRLSMAKIALEPGDRLFIADAPPQPLTLRVRSVQVLEGGQLAVEAESDDPALYPRQVEGEPDSAVPALPPVIAPTALLLADAPALPSDGMTEANLTMAVAADGTPWPGAEVLRLTLGGDPESLARTERGATLGGAITVLPAARVCLWDEANYVDVQLREGMTLASVTAAEVLAGANVALLGGEVIQFRQAEPVGYGRYRLSGLLRGRQGTDDQVGTHALGEAFLLIDGAVLRQPVAPARFGMTQNYQAVTYGARLVDTPVQSFTYRARALLPYAPVHVRALRQPSGDVLVTWLRRTRLGGEWRDGVDVALSEEREVYTLQFLDGMDGVLRQFDLAAAQYLYPLASLTADYGAPSGLRIRLWQISAMAGRGVARLATIPIES